LEEAGRGNRTEMGQPTFSFAQLFSDGNHVHVLVKEDQLEAAFITLAREELLSSGKAGDAERLKRNSNSDTVLAIRNALMADRTPL